MSERPMSEVEVEVEVEPQLQILRDKVVVLSGVGPGLGRVTPTPCRPAGRSSTRGAA